MKTSQKGVTLIEALISLSATLIALGAAVPGFDAARERRHVDGAAAQLETDLQLARSLAVAHRHNVRIDFSSDAAGSCYVVHTGSAGACSCDSQGAAVCSGDAQALRTTAYTADLPVRLSSNVQGMVFEHVRGTVTPTSTVSIAGPRQTVRVVTNIMGRVRACSPSGAAGYLAC